MGLATIGASATGARPPAAAASDTQPAARSLALTIGHDPLASVPGGVTLDSQTESTFASLTPTAQKTMMQRIRASGATWLRVSMPMTSNEYGPGDFTWYSQAEVHAALASGLHVDALLGWPAAWADQSSGAPDMADVATYDERAALHYSAEGVTTFEVWNEPNTNGQWSTGSNPEAYAQLLRTIYPVIKSRYHGDDIMLGGLAPIPNGSGPMTYSALTFLTDVYNDGAKGSFDSVGFHPYSFPRLPAQSANSNAWTYVDQIHALMADHGDGRKKIWYTEFGAPVAGNANDVTGAQQALSYTQAFRLARARSYSGPVFSYVWSGITPHLGDFGLHTPGGQARRALASFSHAIADRSTLVLSPAVPTVRWTGSRALTLSTGSTASKFGWSISVTSAQASTYKGWNEFVDGQPIWWAPDSTAAEGSVTGAEMGQGQHTVILCLYFTDGTVEEIPSPLVDVKG